jgi:putative ABC transport system permease protein
LFGALSILSNVEKSAAAFPSVPYLNSTWSTGLGLEGRQVETVANGVTDDFDDVLGVRLLAGRWFSRDDDAAAWQPVVINKRLARELFGDRDPVNQLIPLSDVYIQKHDVLKKPTRVVGVVEDFRHLGEFSMPGNFLFRRLRLDFTDVGTGFSGELSGSHFGGFGPPSVLVIRVTPGTTAGFEETLVKSLQAVAPDWSFDVRPVADMRTDQLRSYITPLALFGTIAGFLLLMVVLGLTGVIWQSVTRRTKEFGLRRAEGASIADVRRQILAEMVLLTSVAVSVGTALLAQLPLLRFSFSANRNAPPPPPEVFAISIVISAAVIYGLTLLCSWYPSRLATRIQPAEALHYE